MRYRTFRRWLEKLRAMYPDVRLEGDRDIAQAFVGKLYVGEWDGAIGEVFEEGGDQ